jgi:hypothetical protein
LATSAAAARLGHLDAGEVGAENVPAAGGARCEDGHLAAAAPDAENVLPVLDHRGRQQPRALSRPSIRSCRLRCSMNARPLAPFQSAACPAFTATNDTATSPAKRHPAGDHDCRAGMPDKAVLRTAARMIDTATDQPESAIGADRDATARELDHFL